MTTTAETFHIKMASHSTKRKIQNCARQKHLMHSHAHARPLELCCIAFFPHQNQFNKIVCEIVNTSGTNTPLCIKKGHTYYHKKSELLHKLNQYSNCVLFIAEKTNLRDQVTRFNLQNEPLLFSFVTKG
jgi:hypothetical protein